MRNLFLTLMLLISSTTFAQKAIENSKFTDNWSVGGEIGITTPLDFNSVFPLNTNFGIKMEKDFTPSLGMQVEGIAFLNDNHFSNLRTSIKASNLSLNGVLNLSNLFCKYSGSRRFFEPKLVAGVGWFHSFDEISNDMTAKTGMDMSFNLTKNRNHSVVLSPYVLWNLTQNNNVQFNKNNAQLGLNVSYVYHFKNKNKTYSFKQHNIQEIEETIKDLRTELEKKTNDTLYLKEKNVHTVIKFVPKQHVIQFAKGSYELTQESRNIIDEIRNVSKVVVIGTASPEGSADYNKHLSQKRADVVAERLKEKGIEIQSCIGKGVVNNSSNRLVIINVVE